MRLIVSKSAAADEIRRDDVASERNGLLNIEPGESFSSTSAGFLLDAVRQLSTSWPIGGGGGGCKEGRGRGGGGGANAEGRWGAGGNDESRSYGSCITPCGKIHPEQCEKAQFEY